MGQSSNEVGICPANYVYKVMIYTSAVGSSSNAVEIKPNWLMIIVTIRSTRSGNQTWLVGQFPAWLNNDFPISLPIQFGDFADNHV